MATIMTDANLKAYKKSLDTLTVQINGWNKILSDAQKSLNNSVGSTFRANYAKGLKATTNIQKIIDIVQSLKSDLDKLLKEAQGFYTVSFNKSKK